MSSLGDNANST